MNKHTSFVTFVALFVLLISFGSGYYAAGKNAQVQMLGQETAAETAAYNEIRYGIRSVRKALDESFYTYEKDGQWSFGTMRWGDLHHTVKSLGLFKLDMQLPLHAYLGEGSTEQDYTRLKEYLNTLRLYLWLMQQTGAEKAQIEWVKRAYEAAFGQAPNMGYGLQPEDETEIVLERLRQESAISAVEALRLDYNARLEAMSLTQPDGAE